MKKPMRQGPYRLRKNKKPLHIEEEQAVAVAFLTQGRFYKLRF